MPPTTGQPGSPEHGAVQVLIEHSVRHRWLMICLLWMAMLGLGTHPLAAEAHATLIRSTPAHQSVIEQPPGALSLHFNEAVEVLAISLTTPDGASHALAGARVIGNDIHVSLSDVRNPGSYVVGWRVVSADGHPMRGGLIFTLAGMTAVGDEQSRPLSDFSNVDRSLPVRSIAIWLTRCVAYAVLFVVLAALHYQSGTSAALPYARYSLVVGAAAVLGSLGLLGLDLLDSSFTALFDSGTWRAAWQTSYRWTVASHVLALGLGLWSYTRLRRSHVSAPSTRTVFAHVKNPDAAARCRGGRLAATATGGWFSHMLPVVLLGLIAAGLTASGHASTASPVWVARTAVGVHALCIALWIGALWPLHCELASESDQRLILRRFSVIAPWVVAMLLLSGLVLIQLQQMDLHTLWHTAWGRLLLGKLVLVAGLLYLGCVNRYQLTAAVLRGDPMARKSMRQRVRLELLLALMIFALAAGWRFAPPPRAITLAPDIAGATDHVPRSSAFARSPQLHAEVIWQGDAALTTLHTPEGVEVAALDVRLIFSDSVSGLAPLAFEATDLGDGRWRVEALHLPQRSHWSLRIEVLMSEFDRVRLETTLASPR